MSKKDIYIDGDCPALDFTALALFPLGDGTNAWHVLVDEALDPNEDWEKAKDAYKVKIKSDLDLLPEKLKKDGKAIHMFADKTEFPDTEIV